VPLNAKANVLSSIFGKSVSADDGNTNSKNSQNMTLLQANASPLVISKDKNIDDSPDTSIVSGSALLPITNHLTIPGEIEAGDSYSDQISVYVIRKGDSISQIAQMFGVSANTILWANDMKKSDKLVEGDVLLILPISGVEHIIAKGQTLQSIAKLYKVDVNDIVAYNDIVQNAKLAVGDKLIIPNGEMSDEGGDKPAPNLKAIEVKDSNYYASSLLKNIIGYFINPVPTGHKTQGLHGPGKRGIDIGAPTGTNIYASAPGTVIATKTGCKVGYSRCGGGYGNMAIVQHPNGTKTLYAHMSKVLTHIGAKLDRGEILGLVGSTGRSTGPHIHFEVFSAKNPGANWTWAN